MKKNSRKNQISKLKSEIRRLQRQVDHLQKESYVLYLSDGAKQVYVKPSAIELFVKQDRVPDRRYYNNPFALNYRI